MSLSLREQLAPMYRGTEGACRRKQRYGTREIAEQVAGLRMRFVPERLYVYRCTHCDHWHITRMEQLS
jgi:hypothetical protein